MNTEESYYGGIVDATGRLWIVCEDGILVMFDELREEYKPIEGTIDDWLRTAAQEDRVFAILTKFAIITQKDSGEREFNEYAKQYNLGMFTQEIKERAKNELSCMTSKDTFCPRCKEWTIWGCDKSMSYCPDCGSKTLAYSGKNRGTMYWKKCNEMLKEVKENVCGCD